MYRLGVTKRTSRAARYLIHSLARQGVEISGSQIERASQAKIAPNVPMPPTAEVLSYYGELFGGNLVRERYRTDGVLTIMAYRGHVALIEQHLRDAFNADMIGLLPRLPIDIECDAEGLPVSSVSGPLADGRINSVRSRDDPGTAVMLQRLRERDPQGHPAEEFARTALELASGAKIWDGKTLIGKAQEIAGGDWSSLTGESLPSQPLPEAVDWLNGSKLDDIHAAIRGARLASIVHAAHIVYPQVVVNLRLVRGEVDVREYEKAAMVLGAIAWRYVPPALLEYAEEVNKTLGRRIGIEPGEKP